MESSPLAINRVIKSTDCVWRELTTKVVKHILRSFQCIHVPSFWDRTIAYVSLSFKILHEAWNTRRKFPYRCTWCISRRVFSVSILYLLFLSLFYLVGVFSFNLIFSIWISFSVSQFFVVDFFPVFHNRYQK